MGKKRGLTISVVFVLVFALSFFVLPYMNNKLISGMFSLEIIGYSGDANVSMILFVLQWIILIILGIVIYFRFIKKGKMEKSKIRTALIKKKRFETETDFDTLYELLKEKKSLSVGAISELLKIKKDMALVWIKILENNKLVTIDYPMFGDPEVHIKVKKNEIDRIDDKKDILKEKKNIFSFFKRKKEKEIVPASKDEDKELEKKEESSKGEKKKEEPDKKGTIKKVKNKNNLKTKKNSNKKPFVKMDKKSNDKK